MRKQSLTIGAVALFALAGAGSFIAFFDRSDPPGPGLTHSNLKKLEFGMSPKEVEAILGPSTGVGVVPDWARAQVGACILMKWVNADGWTVNAFFDTSFRYVRWEQLIPPDTQLEMLKKRFGF